MKRYTSRYKPIGWRGEPYRHYLAAKGIRTKRYFQDKRGRRSKRTSKTPPSEGGPDRQRKISTKGAEERMTELFKQSLTQSQRDQLENAERRIEELREEKQRLRDMMQMKDADVQGETSDLVDALKLERQLKKQKRQLKEKFSRQDIDEDERVLINAQLESVESRLERLHAEKFEFEGELFTIPELKEKKGRIDKQITEQEDIIDELEGKIPQGAKSPRPMIGPRATSATLTKEQLLSKATTEDLQEAFPGEFDPQTDRQTIIETLEELPRSEYAGLIGILGEKGKLPRRKRTEQTQVRRDELIKRVQKEQDMAAEDSQKSGRSELPAETEVREVRLPAGDFKKFEKTRNIEQQRKEKKKQEAEEEKERKRKQELEKFKEQQEQDNQDQENFSRKFYSKKTDRKIKKAKDDLGPMGRLVAAPVIRSIRSIEHVNESKYGGYRVKEE